MSKISFGIFASAMAIAACKDSKVPDVTPDAPVSLTAPRERVCTERVLGPDPGPTPSSPPAAATPPPTRVTRPADACLKHADCTQSPHGRCERAADYQVNIHGDQVFVAAHDECVYDGCVSDAECKKSLGMVGVCLCQPKGTNQCVAGNCHDDADCAPTYRCGESWICHGPDDTCQSTSNCAPSTTCTRPWNAARYECRPIPPLPPG